MFKIIQLCIKSVAVLAHVLLDAGSIRPFLFNRSKQCAMAVTTATTTTTMTTCSMFTYHRDKAADATIYLLEQGDNKLVSFHSKFAGPTGWHGRWSFNEHGMQIFFHHIPNTEDPLRSLHVLHVGDGRWEGHDYLGRAVTLQFIKKLHPMPATGEWVVV